MTSPHSIHSQYRSQLEPESLTHNFLCNEMLRPVSHMYVSRCPPTAYTVGYFTDDLRNFIRWCVGDPTYVHMYMTC